MFCSSSSQDCRQRLIVGFACLIEMYRVVVGTCLIWFIPHSCDSDATPGYGSISDMYQRRFELGRAFGAPDSNLTGNLVEESNGVPFEYFNGMKQQQQQPCGWFPEGVHSYAVFLNIITLTSFLVLYGIEVYRENALINYLEVTPLLGTDNECVGEIVAKLDPQKRKKLYYIDTVYFGYGIVCMCAFGANSIFSGIVLLHDLDNKTATTFVTDILFMMTKLYRIHYVINTQKNIFYSAYMMNFVQFNDLDPRERGYEYEEKRESELENGVWEEDWISCKTGEKEEPITITIE